MLLFSAESAPARCSGGTTPAAIASALPVCASPYEFDVAFQNTEWYAAFACASISVYAATSAVCPVTFRRS
jgi:hypothetical protein